MEEHFRKIVEDTDRRVQRAFRVQIEDPENPDFGGFFDEQNIIQVKYTIYKITPMIAAYVCPESKFYQKSALIPRILSGLSYVERNQHSNGLFDYVLCNFNSAPDTAFCMKKLIPCYEYLAVHKKGLEEERIFLSLERILKKGADGILGGGFHTPNHRWAITSILLWCSRVFNREDLKQAAKRYLQEGIDCNEDGEYSEKSAGNYNRINNDAMILIAKECKDDSYEQYAIRNLHMMLTYLSMDGSIFTANSTRYDKDHLVYPKDYYLQYLYLGLKYNISEFLAMASEIFDVILEKQITAPDILMQFLNYPQYRYATWKSERLSHNFSCIYQDSGVARVRRETYEYTAMAKKPSFFYFSTGKIRLELRLCGSFYEHRSFCAEEIKRESDKTLVLSQTMKGWYYLPFNEPPKTSNWWKMDLFSRPKLTGSEYDMRIEVAITEIEQGVKLVIRMSGISGAPFRLVFALSGMTELSGSSFVLPIHGGEQLIAADGMITATNGEETLEFGPGFGKHKLLEAKEYAQQPAAAQATVYFTDFTEFEHTILIRTKNVMKEIDGENRI